MKKIGPYHTIHTNLQAFRKNLSTIVLDEAAKDSDDIIIANQDDQLQKGINSLGKKIRPAYRPFTKAVKKIKGQPIDKVTLYDEGDFYKGFHVERTSKALYVDSKDKKTEKLVTKYGEYIFGLNRASIKNFIEEHLKERMQKRFKKELIG